MPDLKEQLSIFWRLAVPYFENAEGAKLQFALLLALTVCNSGVSVVFSYVSRDFWTALSAKNVDQFYELTLRFAAALATATPLTVLYKFQRQRLALMWREWMTTELTAQYYNEQAYYKLEVVNKGIDNPDQRITEDVRAYTKVSLDFFITLMTSVIDLVSFSGILYSIYPDLFYAIFAYAGIGSITTVALGKTLVGQQAEQLVREADLRYSLVRIRENAESIAFYKGEEQEAEEVTARLNLTIVNLKKILGTQRNLEFFTVGYRYLIQILPILVVAPLYFAGTIELGVISQSAGAFNHVLSDLSIVVNEFEGLSSFSAGINRLGSFVTAMESLALNATASPFQLTNVTASLPTAQHAGASDGTAVSTAVSPSEEECAVLTSAACAPRISLHEMSPLSHAADASAAARAAAALELKHLTLLTPDGTRTLFNDVSVTVDPGEHLLIMGNSGAGKSSLLRAVAGLWDLGEGDVTRPAAVDTMFLPQRPYCTLGSLRQQLLYPSTVEAMAGVEEEMLLRALTTVQLGAMVARLREAEGERWLDAVRDWGDMLSLGEQQRLCFARVLVNRPSLVVLDEATSALDLHNEAAMYAAISEVPHLTYVSVGHRPSLLHHHKKRLQLHGAEHTPSFDLHDIDAAALADVAAAQAL